MVSIPIQHSAMLCQMMLMSKSSPPLTAPVTLLLSVMMPGFETGGGGGGGGGGNGGCVGAVAMLASLFRGARRWPPSRPHTAQTCATHATERIDVIQQALTSCRNTVRDEPQQP